MIRGNTIEFRLSKTEQMSGTALYQYDYGQRIAFSGPELPTAYEVHFSNTTRADAVTQIGDETGVDIPDALLQTGKPVLFWVYLHDGLDDGETEYAGVIPVIKRPRPTNETPTPVQQDAITEAIAALNAAVTRTEAAQDAAGTPVIIIYPKQASHAWAGRNSFTVAAGQNAASVMAVSEIELELEMEFADIFA